MLPADSETLARIAKKRSTQGSDKMTQVRIKYFDKNIPRIAHIGGKKRSNWIDLRVRKVELNGEPVEFDTIFRYDKEKDLWQELKGVAYEVGDELKIYTGIAMELPPDREAHIAPRGSTFKNFGLIQVNSVGVVDESYSGDNDEWFVLMIALRAGVIAQYDRFAQFRTLEVMEDTEFIEVEVLGNADRGGHGSSGIR